MTGIVTAIVGTLVGGALAATTVVGLVHSQTAAPSKSPADVANPTVTYGSTN